MILAVAEVLIAPINQNIRRGPRGGGGCGGPPPPPKKKVCSADAADKVYVHSTEGNKFVHKRNKILVQFFKLTQNLLRKKRKRSPPGFQWCFSLGDGSVADKFVLSETALPLKLPLFTCSGVWGWFVTPEPIARAHLPPPPPPECTVLN